MIVFLVHFQNKYKLNTLDFERAFYYAAYAFIDNLKDEGKYDLWVQRAAGVKDLEKIANGFTLARSNLEIKEFTLGYVGQCLQGRHRSAVCDLESYLKYYLNKLVRRR